MKDLTITLQQKLDKCFFLQTRYYFQMKKMKKKSCFWLQHMNIVSLKGKKNSSKFLGLKNLRNLSFLVSYFILLTIITKLVYRLQKSVAFKCEDHASRHVNIVLANGFSQCF